MSITAVSSTSSASLPPEILSLIFEHLSKSDLLTCSVVSSFWRAVAEQNSLWKKHLEPKALANEKDTHFKKFLIMREKFNFLYSCPKELVEAFGGLTEATKLPLLYLTGVRSLNNTSIRPNEMPGPVTLGRLFASSGKVAKVVPEKSALYSFIAIRFINREFDPSDETQHLNVWVTQDKFLTGKNGWVMLTGDYDGGWPTWFCQKDGRGYDFSRTIEYIGRLVRGEPCGVRDICSLDERSHLTQDGKSTVSLI